MPTMMKLIEVAERVRLNPMTVRRLSKSGDFPPPITLGRALRWNLADVERFLVGSTSTAAAVVKTGAAGNEEV